MERVNYAIASAVAAPIWIIYCVRGNASKLQRRKKLGGRRKK